LSRLSRLHPIPILLVVVLALAFPIRGRADKYAAEFLRIGVGARALGMGGAFTALADDGSAAYWNPAGLLSLERSELLFMHAEQFGNLATHDFFGYVQPLAGEGSAPSSAVGLSVIRYGVDDILITRDAWDDLNGNGRPDPGEVDSSRFRKGSDVEWGVLFSYARSAGDRLDLGGNLKVVRQGLLRNTSFGMGVDLGILYRLNRDFALGVRLADITTTQISWDTGTREVVNPSMTLGGRWTRSVPGLRGEITLACDLPMTFEGREKASQVSAGTVGTDLQGGFEYWYSRAIALRFGTSAGEWTAGGGLRYRGFGADYAILPHDDLGDTHRISASIRF
jgi:hypothetical protein